MKENKKKNTNMKKRRKKKEITKLEFGNKNFMKFTVASSFLLKSLKLSSNKSTSSRNSLKQSVQKKNGMSFEQDLQSSSTTSIKLERKLFMCLKIIDSFREKNINMRSKEEMKQGKKLLKKIYGNIDTMKFCSNINNFRNSTMK